MGWSIYTAYWSGQGRQNNPQLNTGRRHSAHVGRLVAPGQRDSLCADNDWGRQPGHIMDL